jgi:hemerythrin-like domain-containing protein
MAADPHVTAATTLRRRASDAPDAITLLHEDHARIMSLFGDYERLARTAAPAAEREFLAAQICHELVVHMDIEERVFYPAIARQVREDELLDEAMVEHQSARRLIAQIRTMRGDDALYDAKLKVLGEYIQHHIAEEQSDLFPKARRRLDIDELGAQMHALKLRLTAQFAPA